MSVDGKKLRAYVAQYESREDARSVALDDMRQLLKDAEEIDGINPKVLRRLIKELKKPRAEVAAEEALLQEYRDAWLSFESTPLGANAKSDDILSAANKHIESIAQAFGTPEHMLGEGVKAKVTRIFADAAKPEIVPPHGTPKHYGVRLPD